MVAKIDDEKTRKSSLLIAPIRTEMLYPEPLVVQFFDVLSDQEATAIQNLANRQLNRATIRDPVGFENSIENILKNISQSHMNSRTLIKLLES